MSKTAQTIHLRGFGSRLLGRALGRDVRSTLEGALRNSHRLVIDGAGVETMSPSFADECFGRLTAELAKHPQPPQLVFHGFSDDVAHMVRFAIANRRAAA